MSAKVHLYDMSVWYMPEEEKAYKCRQDLIKIDYQQQKVTTSYDNHETGEVGIIVTDCFSKFEFEIP